MPATAIDIGSNQIKVLSGKAGSKPVIEKVAAVANPIKVSYPHDDSQAEKLVQTIDKIFHDHKLDKTEVRLSLPEERVSTKIINLPPLTDAELASAIDWQAEQHIPIPLNQLTLEYQVLYRPDKKVKDQPMRVMLVGSRRETVQLYTDVFTSLGIQPTVMETQIFSAIRALGFESTDPTTLMIDLGANNTQLAIIHQAELQLAVNKIGGGNLLTKAVQQGITNITEQQAEDYKKTYGLNPDQLEGKIQQAILPALNSIGQEVVKTWRYYNNNHSQQPVVRIVLTGGTAQMPGIIEYFTQLTGSEVLVASPFLPASGNIPEKDHQTFMVCMGLLMREK